MNFLRCLFWFIVVSLAEASIFLRSSVFKGVVVVGSGGVSSFFLLFFGCSGGSLHLFS